MKDKMPQTCVLNYYCDGRSNKVGNKQAMKSFFPLEEVDVVVNNSIVKGTLKGLCLMFTLPVRVTQKSHSNSITSQLSSDQIINYDNAISSSKNV